MKDRARDSGILASIERAPESEIPESEIKGHRVPDQYTGLDNGSDTPSPRSRRMPRNFRTPPRHK